MKVLQKRQQQQGLFELRESFNNVFNSCIDFSSTVKNSQSFRSVDVLITSLHSIVLVGPSGPVHTFHTQTHN